MSLAGNAKFVQENFFLDVPNLDNGRSPFVLVKDGQASGQSIVGAECDFFYGR